MMGCKVQSQTVSWNFESKEPLISTSGKKIKAEDYKCKPEAIKEQNNIYLSNKGADCLIPLSVFGQGTSEFTFSFNFRGSYFSYISFPEQYLRLIFDYDIIQFSTAIEQDGKIIPDNWVIKLDGKNGPHYANLADGEWHSIVFKGNSKSGVKEIQVDGISYSKTTGIKNSPAFKLPRYDGFRRMWDIDNIEYHNKFSGDAKSKQISQQHLEKLNGKRIKKTVISADSISLKDYAPGHPEYFIDLLSQLEKFPLPRFQPGINTPRNMSWMDINYLHRKYSYPRKSNFGVSDSKYAVSILEEMADYWNYYIDIPTLRVAPNEAAKIYGDNKTLHGNIIAFANSRPDLPASTVMIHAQINPSHAGYDSEKPFILSQNLPDKYYINADSRPVLFNGKKWLSPLMPYDIIEKDGRTAGAYIRELNSYLRKPIEYVNENGEVFGHKRPFDLYKKDVKVTELIKRIGYDLDDFNGWFQNRIDSIYKYNLLSESGNTSAKFSLYDLSASASEYWPSYKMRLSLNSPFEGELRSTPAFYPAEPSNWVLGKGPNSGYGVVAEGRKKEIILGVKKFAPFISPGWSVEENNIRPAQWLGLLKSMLMLGADFYHVGYFNITDSKGKWINGLGPNDPAGYAYQVAVPAYVQELVPYTDIFIENGILLNGDYSERGRDFRLRGKAENHLIIARKLGSSYLIYGSIQKNTNRAGSVPDSVVTEISLDGKKIKFMIRPQGSLYVYNINKRTFIQLDKWHQSEHPYYWNNQIILEAEMVNSDLAKTENVIEDDFSRALSFVSLNNNLKNLKFIVPVRYDGKYKLYVRARSNQTGYIGFKLNESKDAGEIKIDSADWKDIILTDNLQLSRQSNLRDFKNQLTLTGKGNVEIDFIKIIPVN
jgi:hypothetical protein